jgi:prepilin-type N-terminal cleavage/methylation domain-containing protein
MHAPCHTPRDHATALPGGRRAFTLIELVVVIVILAILASLTLSGLNGARQRAKIDKTRSTIRKLHEIVIPIYESYVEKRYSPLATGASGGKIDIAKKQLCWKRMLMTLDMPDQWADVGVVGFDTVIPSSGYTPSAASLRYRAVKSLNPTPAYESAECLQMIVVRGGFAPDALEQFRSDEIGDVDNDNAGEFLDGWGRPISFVRWPAGADWSVVQQTRASVNAAIVAGTLPSGSKPAADPLDPLGISADAAGDFDTALIPLIYSGGVSSSLDEPTPTSGDYGLVTSALAVPGGWLAGVNPATPFPALVPAVGTTRRTSGSLWAGAVNTLDPRSAREARDNITNHDLITK